MAGVKISNLPAAGALTGAELVAIVQGGITSQTTTAAVAGTTGVSTFSAGSTGLTPATATSGAISLAGTLAVANGGTGVTTSTGTGNTVLSVSPTFTGTLAAAAITASTTLGVTGVSTLTGGAVVPTKILVGGPTSAAGLFGVQVYGDATTTAPSVVQRGYSNTTAGPSLLFVKTRGTTATSTTAVQSGDTLGSVAFYGADGTSNQVLGAITGYVDGAVSAGVVPTAITFTTGTSSGTQRIVITSAGLMGIGTGTPASSAIVDVTSTTLGFKFPVMTTTQKNAIASPVAGLVIFDSTLAKLCVYSGSAWQTITSV